MKIQIFIALVAFFALTSGVFVPPRPGHKKHLLGAKECTWGPSYWCQNLTSAAGCHATKHCIQTVWIHRQLPPDTSSVCQTCLDMVKEARDQLESNETQELIKEVFEGSCALLHVKPIVKECDKLFDDYIPDLIDTLASQMNPQIVCSVAGLCNNAKYLKQMQEKENVSTCDGCRTVVGLMEDRFRGMTRDQVLQAFLQLCGKTGSLADGCSNIIITYFTEIYTHLMDNFNQEQVCLLTGECSAQFHTHANVEITPISHIGYVSVGQKADLPCELCEQLVQHLRDILVTNTTEDEFKLVLQGLCKQTRNFKDECLALVNEYYAIAYNFLITELNPNEACCMAGICTKNDTLTIGQEAVPIAPLLPLETASKALEITQKPARINMALDGAEAVYIRPEEAQLPIDALMPLNAQIYNTQTCVFCEYLLHYLQQVITEPKSEEKIKQALDKVCDELPSSVNATCIGFIEMYEPALIAVLAQEVDPSQICPLLRCCPANSRDVDVFMHAGSEGPNCPMCLFAVDKLEQMVKNDKTEKNIKDALTKLCSHLPDNLAAECNDFVTTYTNELVDMLVADFTPQEVCVYLKLCTDNTPKVWNLNKNEAEDLSGIVETNIIPDNTVNGRPEHVTTNPECVVCEFVMKELQDRLKNNATEAEIKEAVHGICNHLPKTISDECNGFVNQYADLVITLLIEATVPSEICRTIHLCSTAFQQVKVEIFDCAMCEGIVYVMEKVLANPKVDRNVIHVLEKTCRALPTRDQEKCHEMMEEYGKTIYDLVIHLADKGLVCREVGLCASQVARPIHDDK